MKDLKDEHSYKYKSLCLKDENYKLASGLENYLNYLKNAGANINNLIGVTSNNNLEEIKNLGIPVIINIYNDLNLLKKLLQ